MRLIHSRRPSIRRLPDGFTSVGQETASGLGITSRVIAYFQPDLAALCPDLVHEAQLGLHRRR
jgi:hypothetical protein